ncbi:hypothetical protein ACFQO4_18125 [Saliphagus sp. GCM10025334]
MSNDNRDDDAKEDGGVNNWNNNPIHGSNMGATDDIANQALLELAYVETELRRVIATLQAINQISTIEDHKPTVDHLSSAEQHLHEARRVAHKRRENSIGGINHLDTGEDDAVTTTDENTETKDSAATELFDEPVTVEADVEGTNLDEISITNLEDLMMIAREIVESTPNINRVNELKYYVYSTGAQVYHTNPECHAIHGSVVPSRHPIKIAHESDRITRRSSNVVLDDECQFCRRHRRERD